jgi:hypothetical protein
LEEEAMAHDVPLRDVFSPAGNRVEPIVVPAAIRSLGWDIAAAHSTFWLAICSRRQISKQPTRTHGGVRLLLPSRECPMSRDARCLTIALLVACLLSMGASYRTQNFIVTADTPELAQEIGVAAERFRRDLAIEWLGRELPPWSDVCPITVQAAPHLGAGGATSFYFQQRRPYGWRMTLQGPRERVLDSVLPHEITHTIFATHFGRPLPRWADEGACTMVEHDSEREKHRQMLIQFLTSGRGIAFNQMFAMREYPSDILPVYSQGYSLAKFLIAQGGKRKFVQYVGDGMDSNNWTAATYRHYGFASLSDLQQNWLTWVKHGSPVEPQALAAVIGTRAPPASPVQNAPGASPAPNQLASASNPQPSHQTNTLFASAADSWYARQRDRVHRGEVEQTGSLTADVPSSAVDEAQPLEDELPSVPTAVTRAPETGRPTQMVLPPLQPVPAIGHPPFPAPASTKPPVTDWRPAGRRY